MNPSDVGGGVAGQGSLEAILIVLMRLELVIDFDIRIGGLKSSNDRGHDITRLPKTPIVDGNRFGFGANRGLWLKRGEDPAADKDKDANDDQTDEDGGKELEG